MAGDSIDRYSGYLLPGSRIDDAQATALLVGNQQIGTILGTGDCGRASGEQEKIK